MCGLLGTARRSAESEFDRRSASRASPGSHSRTSPASKAAPTIAAPAIRIFFTGTSPSEAQYPAVLLLTAIRPNLPGSYFLLPVEPTGWTSVESSPSAYPSEFCSRYRRSRPHTQRWCLLNVVPTRIRQAAFRVMAHLGSVLVGPNLVRSQV